MPTVFLVPIIIVIGTKKTKLKDLTFGNNLTVIIFYGPLHNAIAFIVLFVYTVLFMRTKYELMLVSNVVSIIIDHVAEHKNVYICNVIA